MRANEGHVRLDNEAPINPNASNVDPDVFMIFRRLEKAKHVPRDTNSKFLRVSGGEEVILFLIKVDSVDVLMVRIRRGYHDRRSLGLGRRLESEAGPSSAVEDRVALFGYETRD